MQSTPVMRSGSKRITIGVIPSSLCCDACKIVPWPASIACKAACGGC